MEAIEQYFPVAPFIILALPAKMVSTIFTIQMVLKLISPLHLHCSESMLNTKFLWDDISFISHLLGVT